MVEEMPIREQSYSAEKSMSKPESSLVRCELTVLQSEECAKKTIILETNGVRPKRDAKR
jgi:hypothetical protein